MNPAPPVTKYRTVDAHGGPGRSGGGRFPPPVQVFGLSAVYPERVERDDRGTPGSGPGAAVSAQLPADAAGEDRRDRDRIRVLWLLKEFGLRGAHPTPEFLELQPRRKIECFASEFIVALFVGEGFSR